MSGPLEELLNTDLSSEQRRALSEVLEGYHRDKFSGQKENGRRLSDGVIGISGLVVAALIFLLGLYAISLQGKIDELSKQSNALDRRINVLESVSSNP